MGSVLKAFKIIAGNIRRDILHNVIAFVFVVLAVFMLNLSLSEFRHQEYINDLVKAAGLYDDYIYAKESSKSVYRNDSFSDDGSESSFGGQMSMYEKAYQYALDQLEELKKNGIIEDYHMFNCTGRSLTDDADGDRAEFFYYPEGLAKDLHFPVTHGTWFDGYDFGDSQDRPVPIVVGSSLGGRYRIGEKVSFPGFDDEYIVIGILERNAMILSPKSGGNDPYLNSIFVNGNNSVIVGGEYRDISSKAAAIKMPRDAADAEQAVFNSIGDVMFTFTFKDIADKTYESNRFMTEMQTVLFMLMMLVCAAGVSSGNLLSTIACRKRYATYFLCGMEWQTGIFITLTENILKLFLPSAVGYAVFIRFCEQNSYHVMRVGLTNILVTAAFIIVIFLLTSLKPMLDIKNTSPVRIIGQS